MKTSFLAFGTLSLALGAHAQSTDPTAQNSPTLAPATIDSTLTPLPASNGYEALVAAANMVSPGENGAPTAKETLAPDENLRREREAVTRNAPALAAMRIALAVPIATPPDAEFGNNGKFRELARQLIQESDVRAADGDNFGALLSRLDCIELGVAVSRGPLTSMLTGAAIESVAIDKIEMFAAKLDAAQSRLAATRLRQIEARRPAFAQILRIERQHTLRIGLDSLPDAETRTKYETPDGRKSEKISEKEARQRLALTPETLRANTVRLFNPAIAAARVPFHLAKMVPLPSNVDSITASSRPVLSNPNLRAIYERSVAHNVLLQSAFELRTQKTENGDYPEQFSAPRDPFSDGKSLIYKRAGDGYLLYSIGPDNKDNGGRSIVAERAKFDPETGQTRGTKIPNSGANSKGDIVAPVL